MVPAYYDRDENGVPTRWVPLMKEALRVAGKRFTTDRMVSDYTRQYYAKALIGSTEGDDSPFERPSLDVESDP